MRSTCGRGRGSRIGPPALPFREDCMGEPCVVPRRGCPVVLRCRWPGGVPGAALVALPFPVGGMGEILVNQSQVCACGQA